MVASTQGKRIIGMSWFIYDYPHRIFFEECRSPNRNRMFRDVINDHHSYVDYTDVPQRRINWLIYETVSGNLIGAIGISSAVLAIKVRDDYIGWNVETRLSNLNKVANNYRFATIKENITIDCAGSTILKCLRHYSKDRWKEKYNDPLVLLETYVKPPWKGTVYKADNWQHVGKTKGTSIKRAPIKLWQREDSIRGRLARENPQEAVKRYASKGSGLHYNTGVTTKKEIFVRHLTPDWKQQLTQQERL